MMGDIFLVVPALNPGKAIVDVVEQALRYVTKVVIVDDGSNPAEREAIATQFLGRGRVELISHPVNKGKGFALHTGIKWCLGFMRDSDYVLTMDSDGQHNPGDIPRFQDYVSAHRQVHLLLGERSDIGTTPFKSRFGNSISRTLFRLQFGTPVHDTVTGFRLLSKPFAERFCASVKPGRYETEIDMLVLAVGSLDKIHSIAIDAVYFDGNRNSNFRPIADSFRALGLFAKYGAVSIASFFIDCLIFIVLAYLVGVPYLGANVSARVVGATSNFVGHRLFSFASYGQTFRRAVKYFLAAIWTLALACTLLYVFVEYLGIEAFAAKLAADAIVFVVYSYVLRNFARTAAELGTGR